MIFCLAGKLKVHITYTTFSLPSPCLPLSFPLSLSFLLLTLFHPQPASKQMVKALLDKHRSSVKPPPQPAAASAPPAKSKASAKDQVKEDKPPAEPAEKTKPTKTQSASKGKSTAKGSKSGGGGDEDGALLVMVPHGKEQRMKDEEKMRVSGCTARREKSCVDEQRVVSRRERNVR